MSKMIFVNLPVANLAQATAFYEAVGFTRNPQFSDDTAACMVWSDTIFVMLLTHDKWRTFTPKAIPDTATQAQLLLCLSCDSRQAVLDQLDAAIRAGGKPDPTPEQDYGFMYGRSYEDPDGHIWEIMWMDPAAAADCPPDMAAGLEPR